MRIVPRLPRIVAGLLVVGFALLGTHARAGSEIHRCIDSGHVTYTDRGCSDGGEVVAIAMAPASTNAREEIGGYGRASPVALGMSPRMVYEAMGRPLETIATLQRRTLVEYWIYRGTEGRTRVAFQEGRVARIDMR